MICFEVRLNGKLICIAGLGNLGCLTAILTWVKRDPESCPANFDSTLWLEEELDFHVVGSQGQGTGHEFLDWIKEQPMSVNDEITIKILNQSECDPPAVKRLDNSEVVNKAKRQCYEALKAEYEGEEHRDED